MNHTTLGISGLSVSPIAFGTWQLSGSWGQFDEDAAIAAIRHAYGLGVNLFDTAQAYGFGAAERILGKALRQELDGHRDELVIATKGGLRMTPDGLRRDSSPEWIRAGAEQSLRELGLDHIDLYQLHWHDATTPLAETTGALAELVAEGKLRHVGVSNFDVRQMASFSQTLAVQTLQPPYHLFRRDIEREILPYAAEHDIGVLVYGPLAHGLLSGTMSQGTSFGDRDWRRNSDLFRGEAFTRNLAVVDQLSALARERGVSVAQLAIAWTLSNPAVDVAIVGARRAQNIDDSVRAAQLTLSDSDLRRIEEILADAIAVTGPAPVGSSAGAAGWPASHPPRGEQPA